MRHRVTALPWRRSDAPASLAYRLSKLLEVAPSTHAPRPRHRAQVLLWLHGGDTVDEVAPCLCGTPRTVFRWRRRLHARQALALPERLADGPRSGRPPTVSGMSDTLRSTVSDGDPRPWGDHATVGPAPVLHHYLHDGHRCQAAPTWRQAQGGAHGAARAARGRCSCGWLRRSSRQPHPERGAPGVWGSRGASP
jgi:hypothetical protein